MVPRWLIGLAILIVVIWFFSDPAGMAKFLKDGAENVGIFFSELTD